MRPTLQVMNIETDQIVKTIYIVKSQEDLLRLSLSTGHLGQQITINDLGEVSYIYITQGFETDRYTDFLYLSHSLDEALVESELANQQIIEIGSLVVYQIKKQSFDVCGFCRVSDDSLSLSHTYF